MLSAALGLAVYLGTRLTAGGAPGNRGPISKIGVVNLPLIFKNYEKFKFLEKKIEGDIQKYRAREEKIRAAMMKIQQDKTQSAEAIQEKMKVKKRQLEDLGLEYKQDVGKKQEQQLVMLYKEVENMVKRVAAARGFEMVFQYSDATTDKDRYNPMLVRSKVLGGMCLPLYVAGGLDISEQVYKNLNYYYKNPPKSNRGQ
jgi:Skp family chaperone for outer membrane proteins